MRKPAAKPVKQRAVKVKATSSKQAAVRKPRKKSASGPATDMPLTSPGPAADPPHAHTSALVDIDLHRLREEWEAYSFLGGKHVVRKKRDVLAQVEIHYSLVPACRAAGVLRSKVVEWVRNDPLFANAITEAQDCCVQLADSTMYRTAIAPPHFVQGTSTLTVAR